MYNLQKREINSMLNCSWIIRNLYSQRLEDALHEEFEGSPEKMYEYIDMKVTSLITDSDKVS
jgi:hypothetical protein